MPYKALLNGTLTLGVSRGVVTRRSDRLATPCSTLARLVGKAAKKERLDGCLLPITLPVTVGLGENVAGALNALVPVPASGGGRRPCASRPVDSYEPVSVFGSRCSIEPWSIHMTLFPC